MSRATKPAIASPGPWTTSMAGADQLPFFVLDKRGRPVAITYLAGGPPTNEALANARLIAAAPAMHEALEEISAGIQNWLGQHGDQDGRLVGLLMQASDALRLANEATR